MENQVIQKKLLFLHHLHNLSENSIANKIYRTQKKLSLPGLVQECNNFLAQLQIYDNPSELSPWQWKKMIKKKVHDKNRLDLLNKIKTYKKLDYNELSYEVYEVKSYLKNMSIAKSRTNMSIRSKMCRTVQTNFSNDKAYAANLWTCVHCPAVDSMDHLRWCQGYSHLRDGLDLDTDMDMVTYVQAIIKMREEMNG